MSEVSLNSHTETDLNTRPYWKEVVEVFNVAGYKKLTPKEQAWIREPVTPEFGTQRSEPKKQLFEMSLCVLNKRQEDVLTLESKTNTMTPYAFEVFRTAAVFTDKDGDDYPTLPIAEESKVQNFIDTIKDSPDPIDVASQLGILLKLSDGSIVDAAATGMMASRIVARNLDKKAYPNILVDIDTQEKWLNNLAIFGDPKKENDVLGRNGESDSSGYY